MTQDLYPAMYRKQGLTPRPGYSTFEQHLEWTHALNKKLFIKMDIEGDEYTTLPDILEYTPEITGIVLEIHFMTSSEITKALSLIRLLNNDFLLVHVHGNNNCVDRFVTRNSIGYIPRVLELTYINKNLLTSYALKGTQDHPTLLDMSNVPGYPDAEFTILEGV